MAQLPDPNLSFSAEDCAVFARYPNTASWPADVATADQATFKNIWTKLKSLAQQLEKRPDAPVPLKANTSLYTPNGRSPKEIWCCVYSSTLSNKSYGLQIALIVSERGAEVCFCQGSGSSQIADNAKKQDLEWHFETMRKRLGSIPQELIASVEESAKKRWCYRKSWLTNPNETDFSSLSEWLSYASSSEGSAASASLYYSPRELEALGTGIFVAFADTLKTFGPILKAVYPSSSAPHYWIFQGSADQFDVDRYIQENQEIVWTARQHKERIQTGDQVLVWKSGTAGGVIAECSVIASPSADIPEDAPELWKNPSDNQAREIRCKLRVENSFVDNPISRAAVRTALPELSIIKAPQGTNFEITKNDYEQIMNLKNPAIDLLPFDASALASAVAAIEATNMRIDREFLNRFVSSLAAKPFLILTGLAGSGKTKLAQAFARWISVPTGCYDVVPVGADWSGNENVLGYPNGLDEGTYVSKPALDLVVHAKANSDIPHFLILDEMNLSHVERYFADILSVIESEETIQLYVGTERQANGTVIPRSIELPKNLFIIGTVNVDETTYMFSPKVLDRANVIEFRMEAEELESFLSNPAKPDLSKLDGKGASFGKAFVDAAKSSVDVPADVKPAYEAEMLLLFKALQAHGAEFGYRTAHEAARFIHFYKLLGNHADGDATWFPKAFDCVVFQKLLPKLHGSRAKLGPLLKVLWFLCVTPHKFDAVVKEDRDKQIKNTLTEAKESKADPSKDGLKDAPYPLSAEKIYRMWRLLRDNGFASFAEA